VSPKRYYRSLGQSPGLKCILTNFGLLKHTSLQQIESVMCNAKMSQHLLGSVELPAVNKVDTEEIRLRPTDILFHAQ